MMGESSAFITKPENSRGEGTRVSAFHRIEMLLGRKKWPKLHNRKERQASEETITDQVGDVCLISHSPFWIFKVSARGNLNEVIRLFDNNSRPSLLSDQRGLTAIHHATKGNHLNVVRFLIQNGGDKNARDNDGNTPLHMAIEHSAVDCVNFLLENNVDVTIENNRGLVPINYAITLDAQTSLKALLSHGNFEKDDMSVKSTGPLHVAAKYDRPECATILLEHGFKMCSKCENGFYPIHMAAYHASAKTLEVFIQNSKQYGYTREFVLSLKDADNNTPLHAAVNSADLEAMRVCLKAGALVNAQQDDRSTPVHYACSQGNASMVELMFELQAERMSSAIKLTDAMGMTPLHRAAIFDHTDVVLLLLENGADINPRDSQLRSPVLLAASKGSWNTVYLLIQKGADITIKDKNDRNFVHIAIQNGVSLLDLSFSKNLDLASQLNQADVSGCTPLHYASKEGYLQAIDDLIKCGASVNAKNNANESPFHFAARYGRYNTCRRLLDSKLGPYVMNEKDGLGRTALHIAAREGHFKIVTLLLQRGCSTIRCFQGNSALHMAAVNGYNQCMRSIIAVHANLMDSVNKEGNTALHLSAREGKVTAVTLLLTHGASIVTNYENKSFFDYLIEYRHEEVASAVIKHPRWQEAMDMHSCYWIPMLGIIEYLPSVCLEVLDRCQTMCTCDKEKKKFWVTYNFKYLQDFMGASVEKADRMPDDYTPMEAMNTMVKHGRVDCLSHPVCTHYIKMKWNAYGVWIHMTNMFVYGTFLILLSWFVVTYKPKVGGDTNSTTSEYNVDVCYRDSQFQMSFGCGTAIILTTYMLLNIIKEFVQMWHQRERYLLDTENYLEWVLYVSTLVFVLPFIINTGGAYQWQAATISIFLAWFNVLILLQRFDLFGIYIVMFIEILHTVLHVVFVFSILIIAFGLAFFILLGNDIKQKAHKYPGVSMIRSTMMMLELDYMASFNEPYTDELSNTMPFPYLSMLFLLLFVLLMPILLMNLMIGLAVGDIETVQRNARLKRLAMQVEMHTDLERKLPRKLFEKFDKSESTLYPNCRKHRFLSLLLRVTSGMTDEGVKSDVSQTRAQEQLHEDLIKHKYKLKEMSASMEKQHDLLRLIVQKMEIKSEDDFLDEGVSTYNASEVDRVKGPSLWTSARVRNELLLGSKTLCRWKHSMKSRSSPELTELETDAMHEPIEDSNDKA